MVLQTGLPFTVYTSAPFAPVLNSSGQVIGNSGGDYNADGFNYDVPNTPAFGNHLSGQSKSNFLNGLISCICVSSARLGSGRQPRPKYFRSAGLKQRGSHADKKLQCAVVFRRGVASAISGRGLQPLQSREPHRDELGFVIFVVRPCDQPTARTKPSITRARQLLRPQNPRISKGPPCQWDLAAGTVNKNVEPCPASDSTQIRPSARSTIRLQIASPIPVPGLLSQAWRRLNIPKI